MISFLRRAEDPSDFLLFVLQLHAGAARELRDRRAGSGLLPGDPEHRLASMFGGSNMGNAGGVMSRPTSRGTAGRTASRSRCRRWRGRLSNASVEHGAALRRHHHRRRPQRPGHRRLSGARRDARCWCWSAAKWWAAARSPKKSGRAIASPPAPISISLLQERIVRELELERFGYQRRRQRIRRSSRAFPDGRHLFIWQDRAQDAGRDREVFAARCRGVIRSTKRIWSGSPWWSNRCC